MISAVRHPNAIISSPVASPTDEAKPSFLSRFFKPTIGVRRTQSMATSRTPTSKPSTLEQKRNEWRERRLRQQEQEKVDLPPAPLKQPSPPAPEIKLPKKNGNLKRSVSLKPKTRAPIPSFKPVQVNKSYINKKHLNIYKGFEVEFSIDIIN